MQTTLIPAGAASTVEFKVEVPGDLTLVDHSIFRINKGAMGQLHVDGKERPDILKKISGGSDDEEEYPKYFCSLYFFIGSRFFRGRSGDFDG